MSTSDEFKHESLQDRQSIVQYLDAISKGFSNGKLVFANRDKQIIFEPKGLLKLDVKAKRKSDKIKLSLKVTWKEKGGDKDATANILTIDSNSDQ